jgi:tetratricopeptide (TPR) repeat protein
MFMALSPRRKLLAGIALCAVIIGIGLGIWQFGLHSGGAEFPLHAGDRISSWSFKGAYSGNDALIAQANADVSKLKTLLAARICSEEEATSTMESGSTECNAYDPYDLHVGIGNDHNLLGDGRAAYREYAQAVAIHPGKGLAYMNLGRLFEELGAYPTAADAYAKSVAVEPGQLIFHVARLKFLTTRLPDDRDRILAALKDVSDQFGDTPAILSIEAEWLEAQGKYAEAIKAWEVVKMLSPQDRQASIDAQIARDRAKQ